jgi:hypothetical protein
MVPILEKVIPCQGTFKWRMSMLENTTIVQILGSIGGFIALMYYFPKILVWVTNANGPSPSAAGERTARASKVVDAAVEAKLARRNAKTVTGSVNAQDTAQSAREVSDVRDYSSLIDNEIQASTVD